MTETAGWFCNDFSRAVFGILVIVICLIFGACVLEFRLLQYGLYIFGQKKLRLNIRDRGYVPLRIFPPDRPL